MRYLSAAEALELHRQIIASSGGASGLRDLPRLLSALAQPAASFAAADLYEGVAAKAAALCFALIQGHPFIDGNKRVAHACMEVFLLLNGWELRADVDEQERVFMALAAGQRTRDELEEWIQAKVVNVRRD